MDEHGFQQPSTFMEMLNNLGLDNPRLRLIAEMVDRQSTNSSTEPSLEEKLAKKKRALARLEMLTQENNALREENHLLRERLELVATSLGACPDCWGEDQSCSICQGRGVPGSFVPDRDAFAAYVLPAVRTIHRYTPRNMASSAGADKDKPDTGRKDLVAI